jgi:hypothetical protein
MAVPSPEARCSVVAKALCYKPEGRGVETRIFFNLPIPYGRTRPLGLISNRNEYQKQNNYVSGE